MAEARRFVMKLLGADHRDVETSRLLLSELIGNSLRHSASGRGGSVTVAVLDVDGALRIEVPDGGGETVPCLCSRGMLLESGRGMKLVDVMATRWGFTRDSRASTTTWFELGNTWSPSSEAQRTIDHPGEWMPPFHSTEDV
ncbi:ATP-binding protein [Sphaerisporangium album]|uniref:ATP-binding protein n=1 Tax=Sphaerisporangium album TaxID=509200 RepID=UPI0011C01DAD|nr:ATP-binding protein [Sphaerisporangium album]